MRRIQLDFNTPTSKMQPLDWLFFFCFLVRFFVFSDCYQSDSQRVSYITIQGVLCVTPSVENTTRYRKYYFLAIYPTLYFSSFFISILSRNKCGKFRVIRFVPSQRIYSVYLKNIKSIERYIFLRNLSTRIIEYDMLSNSIFVRCISQSKHHNIYIQMKCLFCVKGRENYSSII